jgi:hypothetical protein
VAASEIDPEYRKGYQGGWNDMVDGQDPKDVLTQKMDDDAARKIGRRHAIRDFVGIRKDSS